MKDNRSSKAVNQRWMEFLSESRQEEARRCFTGGGDLRHDSLLILQDVQWPLGQDSTGKEGKKKKNNPKISVFAKLRNAQAQLS